MSTNQLATTHRFARDLGFTPNKVSTFISIMIDALDRDRSDGLRTMEGSFLDFKKALLAHSVERPPASAGIFDEADVTKIVDYVTNRCDAARSVSSSPGVAAHRAHHAVTTATSVCTSMFSPRSQGWS